MPITDPLVLPPDVMIIAVADLAPATRARLPKHGGPFAVTRPSIRSNSKVVDEHGANLLRRFESAVRIVDAVAAYSMESKLDPEVVLEEAYPILRDCFNDGFLVPADSPQATEVLPFLTRGDMVAGHRVGRLIHAYGEGELHQVVDADGEIAVLKLLRPNQPEYHRKMFARETEVLRHLEGRAAPRLIDHGEFEGQPFILMSWCAGVSPILIADGIRAVHEGVHHRDLDELCLAVLEAYVTVHAAGVVHGDVHPHNVLIDDQGRATLIDFGLARCGDKNMDGVGRGGVGYFLDPALAGALLDGADSPPVSVRDEQYGIAALLYRILTGDHYLDFNLEREAMLRQIVAQPPVPFSRRGVPPRPPIEAVLAKALAKKPRDRFPTTEDLLQAFRAVLSTTRRPTDGPSGIVPGAAELRRRVEACLTTTDGVVPVGPTSSVSHGAGGLAYTCYRMSCLERDPDLLAHADRWISWAEAHEADDDAFAEPAEHITGDTTGLRSPYHRESGIAVVRALVAQAQGDLAGLRRSVADYLRVCQPPDGAPDLTTGRSGTLLGAALLLEMTPIEDDETRQSLIDFGSAEARAIWDYLSEMDVGGGTGVVNLGMAHGWAGILYAQLRWYLVAGGPLSTALEERVAALADLAEPVGRGACWPWIEGGAMHRGSQRAMPGWCNGSAGFVHLWTEAHRVFGDTRFLELARLASWDVWDHPSTVPHLCCGLGGRAYALLAMYRHTGDRDWLVRARALAERAFRARWPKEESLDHQSLYRGIVGLGLLAADLVRAERAAMPFFEAEGWPTAVMAAHV